ncbi:UDP-3-O-acyl-N-acetylglucosamine deacetylase [Lyticum sinuosum]|uniref:UDP-3-O-acyl-N-acetylglucosamine deacetylase n=1 Tax=Lyticum sinuosum TaxID=1332059 RepID=A0AAE5AHI7_9RICK|nr:UDP-3-O-acyl-N-acetylglucosamine deacetylase [Lyticum sinuosum]MDZ5761610.1 UDP-3-O-[3-hydroxymyristoyl] N-acetylglucosamine deacetylase [Lyticum sinuosum]
MSKKIYNYSHFQFTIEKSVSLNGIGLHNGKECNITFFPAAENFGILFLYIDSMNKLNNQSRITYLPAIYKNIVCANMSSKIGNANTEINTIEHLMSSLWGCGIDNMIILVDSVEIPALDGSASLFIDAINKTGLKKQTQKRKYLIIKKEIIFENKDSSIKISPFLSKEYYNIIYNNLYKSNIENNNSYKYGLLIDFFIEFPNIGKQKHIYIEKYGENNFFLNNNVDHKNYEYYYDSHHQISCNFEKTIGKARTFGFIKDAQKLWELGLALGANTENVILINEKGLISNGNLRFKNEFVRHKILDCIGDLYLSGYRLVADVVCHKSGHSSTIHLLHKIFADSDNYEIVEAGY